MQTIRDHSSCSRNPLPSKQFRNNKKLKAAVRKNPHRVVVDQKKKNKKKVSQVHQLTLSRCRNKRMQTTINNNKSYHQLHTNSRQNSKQKQTRRRIKLHLHLLHLEKRKSKVRPFRLKRKPHPVGRWRMMEKREQHRNCRLTPKRHRKSISSQLRKKLLSNDFRNSRALRRKHQVRKSLKTR